jgi:hypothetical protein
MKKKKKTPKSKSITVLFPATNEQREAAEFDGFAGDMPAVIISDKYLDSAKESMTGKKWARVIATVQLWAAFSTGDEFAIQGALEKLQGPDFAELATKMFSSDFAARWGLMNQFGSLVKSAHPVLFQRLESKRIETAILCKNLVQALVVRKAFDGLGVCLSCGKTFHQKRTDELFCSVKCGNRFRQQRRRSKSKFGGEKNHGRLQTR